MPRSYLRSVHFGRAGPKESTTGKQVSLICKADQYYYLAEWNYSKANWVLNAYVDGVKLDLLCFLEDPLLGYRCYSDWAPLSSARSFVKRANSRLGRSLNGSWWAKQFIFPWWVLSCSWMPGLNEFAWDNCLRAEEQSLPTLYASSPTLSWPIP